MLRNQHLLKNDLGSLTFKLWRRFFQGNAKGTAWV